MLIARRRRLLGTVLIAALAVLAAHPGVSPAEEPGLEIAQTVYDDAGQPWVFAAFVPDYHLGTATWWTCSPGAPCVQGPTADWLRPGAVPAGTIFEARGEYQGVAYAARSPAWNGPLRPVTGPSLKGRPVSGQKVRPIGAHWAGGWDRPGDGSFLHVEACRTAKARHCVTLSAQGGAYPNSGAPPIIARRYVGWYLFAIDERWSRDVVFAGVGYAKAEFVPPAKVGPTTVRSRPYGPVRAR